MKYVYINTTEDRIVCIAKKQDPALALAPNISEYSVSDTFDIDKEIQDEDGNIHRLQGGITATEFLSYSQVQKLVQLVYMLQLG